MKTARFFEALFIASCFMLSACDNGKIKVKGADGTEYESYQECCSANDFEAAHRYLAKMENHHSDNLDEAKDFVFKQEALFLMGIGDETAKKRIIYLLKEEGGNDLHIDMLIDLAIDNDDEEFAKKLANQLGENHNHLSKTLAKVVNYISTKPSEENKQFLMTICTKLNSTYLLVDLAIKNDDKAFIEQYALNNFSFSNTALMNYLITQKEKKYSAIIIGKLTEDEGRISKKPQMGTVKFDGTGKGTSEFEEMCNNYIQSVEYFNSKCNDVLGAAIKNKNLYLAQCVLPKFKSNIHVDEPGWIGKFYNYKITDDNEDINSARATLNEAIRSGLFK